MKVFTIVAFCAWLTLANAYKILGVFPMQSKSHFAIGNSVMKSLVDAGHEVTIISPYPSKKPQPNVRDISIAELLDDFQKDGHDPFAIGKMPVAMMMVLLIKMGADLSNKTLSHPNVQKLINSNEKFDAVVVEVFNIDSLMGLAQHFDCPLIGVTTFGAVKWIDKITGNQSPYSYVPQPFLSYTDKMTFPQRLYNTVFSMLEHVLFDFVHIPMQAKIYHQHFPKSKLSFSEVVKSPAIVLLNNHVSSSSARPYLPNLIEISGVHVEEVKPLPEDIKNFLDNAEDGVIYFSMGSFIQSKNWPIEKRQALVNVFGKLKQKVLWKYENETLPGNPGNIMIGSWLPQRDILAHPNVKVFITHGGLLGTTEALVEGVPVLGIPIFGDQKMNMAKAFAQGWGLKVDFGSMDEDSLLSAIEEVLSNPKYSEKVKYLSDLYRDRPLSAKETAIYWVEYVIKHKGAPHLRYSGADLNFLQYNSLDVIAFITFIIVTVLTISIKIFNFLIALIFCNKQQNIVPKKSKKSKKSNKKTK
ncbi:unnamed protein product [Diamesa tonsa]